MPLHKPAYAAKIRYKKAVGITDISTNSEGFVDMTNMSLTVTTGTNPMLISANLPIIFAQIAYLAQVRLVIDDVEEEIAQIAPLEHYPYWSNAYTFTWLKVLTTGVHTIKIQWRTEDNLYYIYQKGATYPRQLTILELDGAIEL